MVDLVELAKGIAHFRPPTTPSSQTKGIFWLSPRISAFGHTVQAV